MRYSIKVQDGQFSALCNITCHLRPWASFEQVALGISAFYEKRTENARNEAAKGYFVTLAWGDTYCTAPR